MQQRPWDPDKARLNLAKHGVSFEDAWHAVNHPLARHWPDFGHSHEEERTFAMGFSPTGSLLLVVTATARNGTIRVISARRATKRERNAYEND